MFVLLRNRVIQLYVDNGETAEDCKSNKGQKPVLKWQLIQHVLPCACTGNLFTSHSPLIIISLWINQSCCASVNLSVTWYHFRHLKPRKLDTLLPHGRKSLGHLYRVQAFRLRQILADRIAGIHSGSEFRVVFVVDCSGTWRKKIQKFIGILEMRCFIYNCSRRCLLELVLYAMKAGKKYCFSPNTSVCSFAQQWDAGIDIPVSARATTRYFWTFWTFTSFSPRCFPGAPSTLFDSSSK